MIFDREDAAKAGSGGIVRFLADGSSAERKPALGGVNWQGARTLWRTVGTGGRGFKLSQEAVVIGISVILFAVF